MNVLYHLDEEKRWPLLLTNVSNMLLFGKQHQKEFHIEIVINARAVRQLKKEIAQELGYAKAFEELLAQGVIIAGCQNALRSSNINEADLQEGITLVPSGVVEIAEKQQEGYSYIKP